MEKQILILAKEIENEFELKEIEELIKLTINIKDIFKNKKQD